MGWLVRQGVQFHWQNRSPLPYANFEDFLASLQRDKRKKIQQERRKVREAGVSYSLGRTSPTQTGPSLPTAMPRLTWNAVNSLT